MNTFGQSIRLTLFGESHGEAMGIVIDGMKPGIKINHELIQAELTKRRPKSVFSTARAEQDDYSILSGVFEGKTTGAPITFVIRNQNVLSRDYADLRQTPRPSHADYTAFVKYHGFNDPRGGGMFSGRITSLMMIAGALAKQVLAEKGIYVASHIKSIKDIEDDSFDPVNVTNESLHRLNKMDFPVLNPTIENVMKDAILKAKDEGDSVGGVVETAVLHMPAGIGDPLFDSVESYLSALLFSVPAVKGIEFGTGFQIAKMLGSDANDNYVYQNGAVRTETNHNGGLLGGITTGMPVILRVAIKPTPSIGKPQKTVNVETNEATDLEIRGRHDPAIVNRVVHVIDAAVAFGMLDMMVTSNDKDWSF